jgi:hypothetical protein
VRSASITYISKVPSRRWADQAREPLAVCPRTDRLGGSTHPNLRPSCQSWVHLLREDRVGKPFATILLADCGASGFDGEDAVHLG